MRIFDIKNEFDIELTVSLLKKIIYSISANPLWMIYFYAFIGISIKFAAIYRYSSFMLGSLLIYFSYIFLLHECVQIRAGIASGLLLFLIPSLANKERIKSILIFIVAVFFHYSALAFFLLFFINPLTFNKRRYIILLICCYLIRLSGFNPSSSFQALSYIGFMDRFTVYADGNDEGALSIFSAYQIVKLIFLSILIMKSDLLAAKSPLFCLLIKISILSTAFFVLFAFPGSTTIALRTYQLFSSVEILLIPMLFFIFREKIGGKLLIVLFSLVLFYSTLKMIIIL